MNQLVSAVSSALCRRLKSAVSPICLACDHVLGAEAERLARAVGFARHRAGVEAGQVAVHARGLNSFGKPCGVRRRQHRGDSVEGEIDLEAGARADLHDAALRLVGVRLEARSWSSSSGNGAATSPAAC